MRPFLPAACIAACVLASGCQRESDVQVPPGWLQHQEVRKVTGTIRFLDIEGGCWALDIGDRRLEPIDLHFHESYRVDGLPVTASVRAETDKTSICSIGQMVSIIDIQRRIPLASGDYVFVHKYAEHPEMPSIQLTAQIREAHIRLINNSQSAVFPIGVIDEGDLLWHASSKEWIIVQTPADASANEVGGCSDGPTVVDLERRIYWTC